MQDFMENFTILSQSFIKPITELTELNANTLNKLAKNEAFQGVLQAKKPEELLAAQAKLANAASLETIKHTQEACGILINAATQTGKILEEIIRKATAKSADVVQSGLNKVKEKTQN
jgi:hypothetical protein